MAHYHAQIEHHSANISSDFGYKVACEKFGEGIVAMLPVFTRGPRKGKPKGTVCWRKCTRGGWVTTGPSYAHGERTQGHVQKPGTFDWRITMSPNATHDHGIVARWHWLDGPYVELIQKPVEAIERFKRHGDNPRYA